MKFAVATLRFVARSQVRCSAGSTPSSNPGTRHRHSANITTEASRRYRFHPGSRVTDTAPGAVLDASGGRWEGDVVIVATGAAYDHLPAALPLASRLRHVRLQMFETDPYPGQLTTALADADSLRYYPAYEPTPAARARGAERDRVAAPSPAASGPAARRRAHDRRHPCLRRAVRLRTLRGTDHGARVPGHAHPRRRVAPRPEAMGRRVRGVQRWCRLPARADRRAGVARDGPGRAGHDLLAGDRRDTLDAAGVA